MARLQRAMLVLVRIGGMVWVCGILLRAFVLLVGPLAGISSLLPIAPFEYKYSMLYSASSLRRQYVVVPAYMLFSARSRK